MPTQPLLISLCLTVLAATPLAAQDDLPFPLPPGALQTGRAAMEAFPGIAQEAIESVKRLAEAETLFDTEEDCLATLQTIAHGAALVANLMPFSTAHTFEEPERGPVVRTRALLAGNKLHAEAHCEGPTLVTTALEWGVGSRAPKLQSSSTLDVVLGAALIAAMQGAFADLPTDKGEALDDGVDADERPPLGALGEAGSPPPLSQGEQDAFRIAVERCWIVDPGAPAAAVTITVGMRLTRDAKPDTASIELLGAMGGDESAIRMAFESARRAILRCGAEGFPLPAGKYGSWEYLELTFNPEDLRVR